MTKTKPEDVLRVYGGSASDVYDDFMLWYFKFVPQTRAAYEEFFEKLELKPGQEVLEVGVGTGSNIPFYRRDIKFTGIDLTPEMIEVARVNARFNMKRDARLSVEDGAQLPYINDAFDVVTSTYNLCVTENPKQVLHEMIRVCKPGGKIGVFDYRRANGNPQVAIDQEFLKETMMQAGLFHNGRAAVVFDPTSDLDQYVTDCGLEVLHKEVIEGNFTDCAGAYVMRK